MDKPRLVKSKMQAKDTSGHCAWNTSITGSVPRWICDNGSND
jgi:hypothetical protein